MTINLKTLDRWSLLKPSETLVFDGHMARRIRLNVNSPGKARFYLVDDKKERFLAAVDGLGVLEFVAAGTVEIATKDEEVFCYSAEHEPTYRRVIDPVVFTKIAQRKARNPELEQMMFLMNQNMERRMAQQSAEYSAQLAAIKEAHNAAQAGNDGNDVEASAEHQQRATSGADGGPSPVLPTGSDVAVDDAPGSGVVAHDTSVV